MGTPMPKVASEGPTIKTFQECTKLSQGWKVGAGIVSREVTAKADGSLK